MRPNFPQTSSGGRVIYNTDVIRQVAGKILANVGITQPVHQSTWNTIQTYLENESTWLSHASWDDTYAVEATRLPNAYHFVKSVLEPHEKRLRASFDLQIQVAQALFDLADQIDAVEQKIADGFQPDPPSLPPPTHGPTF